MNKALLLIDLQNDYFPKGKFPLWNTDKTLQYCITMIQKAQAAGIEVIHIQHIADPAQGLAPFFNENTEGAEIHKDVLIAAPDAPIVIKHYADSFHQTKLEELLKERQIEELFVCGMMTQNCVTHTAISKAAENYQVSIVTDCCTTVNEPLHQIALHAVSTRCTLTTAADAF